MKRFAKVISVVLAIVFLSAGTAFAEALSYKMPALYVVKTTVAMKMDAKTLESSWKKATNVYATMKHWETTATKKWTKVKPAGAASVSTLKYLWDSKNIYVYIVVQDPKNYTGSIQPVDFDAVEYHIDAKNCDRASYNGKCDAQYRLSRPYKRANGKTYTDVSGWGAYNAAAFRVNSKSIGTTTSYTQEVKIVLAHHGVATLKAKQKVGFDIQVNDASPVTAGRRFQIVWNSMDNAWINPSTMGTLIMK
ncbi:MAG: sugar-binding protein [Clostridia bacterium]